VIATLRPWPLPQMMSTRCGVIPTMALPAHGTNPSINTVNWPRKASSIPARCWCHLRGWRSQVRSFPRKRESTQRAIGNALPMGAPRTGSRPRPQPGRPGVMLSARNTYFCSALRRRMKAGTSRSSSGISAVTWAGCSSTGSLSFFACMFLTLCCAVRTA